MVFAKVPEAGKVKTRLATVIGDDAACELHRRLVDDTLALARHSGFQTTLFFYPPGAGETVRNWLGPEQAVEPQTGSDLGERMACAFAKAFVSYERAVLIGSDVPDLPLRTLCEAFDSLETHDAAIGPTRDGGYCLIGFSRKGFTTAPFRHMLWGRPRVFGDTMDALKAAGSWVHVLPAWRDIDDYDDLRSFFLEKRAVLPGTLSSVDFLRGRFGF